MVFLKALNSIFPQKFKNQHCIALDIGTEVVKALLFERRADHKGYVIGVGRSGQRLSDMQSGIVTDIWGVVENCQKAIEEAFEMAKKNANQVIIGIAGELVKGSFTTVSYVRKNPKQKISLEELQEIVKKIQWEALEKVRQQLSWETGYKDMDVRLVNAAIVDVQIDGYKITNPLGFQGKNIVIGVFNAFAPLVHIGALQTIASELELDLLSVAAEPYAMARSLGEQEAGEFSAIFIDIGGGTTDIALMQKGALFSTKSFALGGRAITKRIAQEFYCSFAKAEEMKIAYSNGKLAEADEIKVKECLGKDCEVWMSGVEMILEEFATGEQDPLPARIMLCGGGAALPEIKKVLREFRWTSNLNMLRKPEINLMIPSQVSGILDETGLLNSQQDITPMGLANLALQLTGKEKLMDKVMRKVVDMINS